MADKDVVDPTKPYLMTYKLNLGSLTTIDEEEILVAVYQLSRMVPAKSKRS